MLTLKALGPLDVQDGDGHSLTSLLAQPKRAALFAYLVLARRGELHRRDALLALFWPDLDQSHARNALSQALSFLRREVDAQVLITRGAEEVGIDADKVTSDVRAFGAAMETGDWSQALEVYIGPLLEGLHVTGAAPFMDWVDRERARLADLHAKALESLGRAAAAAGDPARAADWWKRLLTADPLSSSVVLNLMQTLAAAGDPASAIQQARAHERLLRDDARHGPPPRDPRAE